MIIAVGSSNPAKIKAVEKSFAQAFENLDVTVISTPVNSDVNDQPMTDEETRLGATNRALKCSDKFKEQSDGLEAEYCIGLEGGVCEIKNSEEVSLHCCAWMAVYKPSEDRWGLARTATFPLPPAIVAQIRAGVELGHACDAFFKTTGSKKEMGAVGLLTHGAVDRIDYYAHALLMALIPFKNGEAFFATALTAEGTDRNARQDGQQTGVEDNDAEENVEDGSLETKKKRKIR